MKWLPSDWSQSLQAAKHRASTLIFLALWQIISLSPTEANAARVYYVNQPENGLGKINAVLPDGTGHATLYTTPVVTDLRGIAVDPVAGTLHFAYTASDPVTLARTEVSIRSMPVLGGTPVTVANLPDGTFVSDVEWDEVNSWIYLAQTGDQQLRRVKPDGSQLSTVITTIGPGSGPYFFGLDLKANLAYWAIGTQSGDTNTPYGRGSLITGVIDSAFSLITPSRTRDIAVDNRGSEAKLYWCDRQNGAVYNRLAEGGPVFTSRSGLNAPHGLVLDLEAGKGYVADTGKRGSGSQPSAHRVVRFNLDGTGTLEFLASVDALAEPWDLAIDLTSTNYADWKTRFFAAGATNAGPGDDPDGDGRPNAAEYAFFTHPERPDTGMAAVEADGRNFTYARRRQTDIGYRVEVSSDLQTWHWNGDTVGAVWTVETETTPRDADSLWITVEPAASLASETKLFFRLRATEAGPLAPSYQAEPKRTRASKRVRRLR
jgi:hypothetical protein